MTKKWFGARRLLLKSRYLGEQARGRVGSVLSPPQTSIPLSEIHHRLELVLAAAYGRAVSIAPIEDRSIVPRRVRELFHYVDETPTIDGETIKLPARLMIRGDRDATLNRYRLLAMEQAERIVRGTLAHAEIRDPLERDLYLLHEAAAIDERIARTFPGMQDTLAEERAEALAHRPSTDGMTKLERDVESLLVKTLTDPPSESDSAPSDPEASRAWAKQTASDIRRGGGTYRGIPLASAWGRVRPVAGEQRPANPQTMRGIRSLRSSGGSSKATNPNAPNAEAPDENSKEQGSRPNKKGRESEKGAPAKRSDSPTQAAKQNDSSPDSASSNDVSKGSQTTADSKGKTSAARESTDHLPRAIPYDEWNSERGVYVKAGASVRLYEAGSADATWLRGELVTHAATARQIRHQFERLRARRTLSMRQPRGDALDLAACVDAITARHMGEAPDDRLYVDARPARRGIAITLLIDASGSTDARVTEAWRIIDIEKIALLLATQALDALGDIYAVYAFAGRTAQNVKMTVVKDFAESNGDVVTRRIAALTPEGYTRLGAAVRHATRELARQTAGHRLLLLLSDGRPNDADMYGGPYGVEDSRQAILEARASGVFPYCITIDREASEYLPRIFGKAGHTILERPEQLPKALLAVVRGLITT